MLLKAEGLYVFGPYRLDTRERQLLRNGETVSLPPKAFDVLVALVSRGGHLVTKEDLLAEVWAGTFVEDANLSYTVSLVRKALGEETDPIETVPKVGYRFLVPVSLANGVTPAIQPAATRQPMPWRVSGTVIAVIILLGLLGASTWIALTSRIARTSIPEPTTVPVTSFGGLAIRPNLSPDGKRIAYQWDGRHTESEPPNWDIYVQSLEGGGAFRLTTSRVPECCAVWSPDGERIAFVKSVGGDRNAVQIKPAMGGTEQTVIPPEFNPAFRKIDWSPDGNTLAFTVDRPDAGGIALFSFDTGRVRTLTSPSTGSIDRGPSFSPNGRTVAFIRNTITPAYGYLYTVGVADGRERQITSGGLVIFGADWSADGKELIFSSNRTGPAALWRIAADASEVDPRPVAGVGTNAYFPTVASKGNRLAYNDDRQDQDIWRTSISAGHDAAGPRLGPATLVHGSTRMDASPQVSRDGKRLVFASQRSGNQDIWVSDIDGLNPLQIASLPGSPAGSPRWSPTGTRVAFDASIAGHYGIFVVGAQGGKPLPLTHDLWDNVVPSWSGDEKWIYFSSNQTGRFEVWKIRSDGGDAKPVTRGGGFVPFESGDGKFIYYLRDAGIRGIWRVPVEGGEEKFVVNGPSAGFWGYWTLLPDGIFFATQESDGSAPWFQSFGGALVQYFDFKSGGIVTLDRLDSPAIGDYPAFVVSPDQGSIYYVKAKPRTADIMLVKNFR